MSKQNVPQSDPVRKPRRYTRGLLLILTLLLGSLLLSGIILAFLTLSGSQPGMAQADIASPPLALPLTEAGSIFSETETAFFLPPEASAGTEVATAQINESIFTLQTFSLEQSGAQAVAWGDYDNDGDLDLAIGSGVANHVYRNENGQLTSEWVWEARGDFTRAVAWGDYDNDGDLDLAVGNGCHDDLDDVSTNCSPHPSRIYGNDGDGNLTRTWIWSTPFTDVTKSIAWGDYDGDSDLDLFVGNLGEDRIYRNDHQLEDGNTPVFNLAWVSPFTDDTQSIALGDYDRDGDLDLMIGNGATRQGTAHDPDRLYRNNCKTNEGTPAIDCSQNNDLTVAFSPVWTQTDHIGYTTSIAWGDYDGDGWLDLVIGNRPLNPTSFPPLLYRNVYSNTPESPLRFDQSVGITPTTTRGVAWGDYDSDGDLDLALGNWSTPSWVYQNNDEGLADDGVTQKRKFERVWASSSAAPDLTNGIAWGDYDNDGDLDLVVGNEGIDRLYRNEHGSLTTGGPWQSSQVRRYTNSIAWGDYNKDGWLDLAVGNGCKYTWEEKRTPQTELVDCYPDQIYHHGGLDSQGVPIFITSTWESSEREFTTSVAWGDVNRDSWLDLAVGNDCSQLQTSKEACRSVRIYVNRNGVLETTASWSSIITGNTLNIAWGDVDGDGWLDLAVGNGCDSGAQYCHERRNQLYRNIDGTLEITPSWISDEAEDTYSVAWGDYDNDGDLDLMAGSQNNALNRLYRNQRGTLSTKGIKLTNDRSVSVAWGDYDGDGNLDLATGNYNRPTRVYRNEGSLEVDGITPKFTEVWWSFEIDLTSKVAWGDYDNDGDLDLLVGTWGAASRVYRNDSGRLTPNAAWKSIADRTISVAWGDYDNDGDLDLATGQGWTHTSAPTERDVLIYPNTSDTISGTSFLPLVHIVRPGPPDNANFYSSPNILPSPVSLIYTLTHPLSLPVQQVRGWYSLNGGGKWLPAIPINTKTLTLTTSPTGRVYTYTWDVLESGVLGQSDNVIFRLVAVPAISNTANSIPGPYLYGSYAATTFPFRVRGSQVYVQQETGTGLEPAPNALVYRLPITGSAGKFEPYTSLTGQPFRTDSQGYLQGRGTITEGDRLVALLPVSLPLTMTELFSNAVELYYTSAKPITTGLATEAITLTGVQTLTVSPANPLILFNLSVSLEWDARNDQAYRSQLDRDLQRVSEILYDLSNGQMALGQVKIYQAREHWLDADIVIHASNNIRPNATIGGGIWAATAADEVYRTNNQNEPATTLSNAYIPGQVRMGANWTRFGDLSGDLGEDWPRALAHELGHYLLFLPDNYLGINENDLVVEVDCPESIMTNPYRDDYSEFLIQEEWDQGAGCGRTLAANTTRRVDWATITQFYPPLKAPQNISEENPGPNRLPLQVTQIEFVPPPGQAGPLADPFFNLTDIEDKALFLDHGRAQGYLFKNQRNNTGVDDLVIALGAATGDLLQARGAAPDDRLCVFDYGQSPLRLGCEFVIQSNRTLSLTEVSDWPPRIEVTPVTSRTFVVTATFNSPFTQGLGVQILPASNEPASGYEQMERLDAQTFRKTIEMDQPVLQGFVRVCAPTCDPRDGSPHEILVEFILGDGWPVPSRPGPIIRPYPYGGYYPRFWSMRRRYYAPISSGDGQVTIFNLNRILDNDTDYTLETLPLAPNLPSWLTPVGQAYRFSTTDTLTRSSILFQYLERNVPPGEEHGLKVYYSGNEGQNWTRLKETEVNQERNLASAKVISQGIYALISTLELPPFAEGWNLFGYPVRGSRPVTEALASLKDQYTLEDQYTSVYHYDPARSPRWRLYDRTVVDDHPEFAWLVNDELTNLEFGQAYWVHVLTPTEVFLGAAQTQQLTHTLLPPATFYGEIKSANLPTTVDRRVTALIDNQKCGETQAITDPSGNWVYKIQVSAPDRCGAKGSRIVFEVEGREMAERPEWNNSQAQYQDLTEQGIPVPILKVSKTAFPNPVAAGGRLTYTIYYSVSGSSVITGLTLVDTLPPEVIYQGCQGGLPCSESGGKVTWTLGDVTPPAAGIVTLVVQTNNSLPGGTVINNEVILQDGSGQQVTSQAATTVDSGPASCANNLLVNGQMENDERWILDWGAIPGRYITDPRGQGRSLFVGQMGASTTGRPLWSSARQTVMLPAKSSITLSLNHLLQADTRPGFDDPMIAILNRFGQSIKIWHLSRNDSNQWRKFEQDISQYAGQTVQIYAGVANDGYGGGTSLVVDDVAVCVK